MANNKVSHPSNLLSSLNPDHDFIPRHNALNDDDILQMITSLGVASLDELIDNTVPESIRLTKLLNLPAPLSEAHMLAKLKAIANKNTVNVSLIGQGYYDTHTPAPILRNVLENPGWYTAYTPYQPEISQGRLTSLLNFQQMVIDLTGMAVSNASLLDEATAAAEAMTLCQRSSKSKSAHFFVANGLHPQTLSVLTTRARFLGITIISDDISKLLDHDVFGCLLQYPSTSGEILPIEETLSYAKENNILSAVATDLLGLTLLKPPGELGADVVIGSAQRFGVPLGFGGPHAAFMAVTDKLKRNMPGRIIGVSRDAHEMPALRMAMQTREQHIRREKATSNICTAQALLANMAAFYAVYHGAEGLTRIARRVHHYTAITATALTDAGLQLAHHTYFDTITLLSGGQTDALYQSALNAGINVRRYADKLGISFDETTNDEIVIRLIHALTGQTLDLASLSSRLSHDEFHAIPTNYRRTSPFLTHPVFHHYQSETLLMRYMKQLENKDFSLTHGMIPLGSCTMKLNAAAEMLPVTWEAFSNIHPFAPREQTVGYQQLADSLCAMLCEVTGYDAVSLQPNSGAQGEYAGLLAIQRYHQNRGEGHRNICLIPSSAHGTNPASASMVSLTVVMIKCDKEGNIDLNDVKEKIDIHGDHISCMMITYPSTHGVFEQTVQEICHLIHAAGGQVYLDGANMNAQVGLTSPGFIGADVSHLNLHKTFCIPHGGGGPGMGPIGVKKHLAPFIPPHESHDADFAVSAAPMGSASILPISWAYIHMMGAKGLTQATEFAILNANYIMTRLRHAYPILYRGRTGFVAHECIIDIRPIKETTGISEEDIAKRLMDYGFHAPTMSFPVAGTLMIEPTESESKTELDRFCDAMLQIREEIRHIETKQWPQDNNPLVNAPHTQSDLMTESWAYPYSREIACFPSKHTQNNKYWPSVKRVDNVYGDRNLICGCGR